MADFVLDDSYAVAAPTDHWETMLQELGQEFRRYFPGLTTRCYPDARPFSTAWGVGWHFGGAVVYAPEAPSSPKNTESLPRGTSTPLSSVSGS